MEKHLEGHKEPVSMTLYVIEREKGAAIARLDGISLSARVGQLIRAEYDRRRPELERAGLLVEEAQGEGEK